MKNDSRFLFNFGRNSLISFLFCIEDSAPNVSPTFGRRRSSNMLKKHVQFPEDFKCFEEEEEVLCMTDSNGNGTEPVDSQSSMYTMNFGQF